MFAFVLQAGEDRWGTDELAFNEVLAKRSHKQLRATFQAYQIVSKQAPGQWSSHQNYYFQKKSRSGIRNCGGVLQQQLLIRDEFASSPPQGIIGNAWKHLGCHLGCWGGNAKSIQQVKAIIHPTMHRTAPQQRLIQLQMQCQGWEPLLNSRGQENRGVSR